MKPQAVARELGQFLRDDAIVAGDSGTSITWFARHLEAKIRAGEDRAHVLAVGDAGQHG